MNKHEASFQTIFGRYLKARKRKIHGHFELKQTRTDSIPFSCVKEHQENGLYAAQRESFFWKHSDQDERQKPFDCSYVPPLTTYVVIKYALSRKFYIITYTWFLKEKEESKRKSLTEERAKKICAFEVQL